MELLYAVIAAVVVSALALVGILLLPGQWSHTGEQRLLGFAAGVLLATASLQLLPEAIELQPGRSTYYALLVGIVGFFILERVFRGVHTHHAGRQTARIPGYLIIVGDAIHNFIDGIAIAIAFQVSPALGVTATLAIAAHEVPQELADYVVLRKSGFSKARALLLNLASGLTAVLGVAAVFAFGNVFEPYQPIALALTAGIFLYIAAVDIIPELSHQHPTGNKFALPLLAGVILVATVTAAVPEHGHDEEAEHSEHIESRIQASSQLASSNTGFIIR